MKKTLKIWVYIALISGMSMILSTSCTKSDDNVNDSSQSGQLKDVDGNIYTTVTIGTQVWMVENLKTTKFRNGDPIPNVTDEIGWAKLKTGAYSNYENNVTTGNKYGRLYNWYAVADNRNIAPKGWHVPTDAEWTTLKNYVSNNLGTSRSVGKALAAKTDWYPSSYKGDVVGNDLADNNSSGFTGFPSGGRHKSGYFYRFGDAAYWYSSTEFDTNSAWHWSMSSNFSGIEKAYGEYKEYGFSIRCIKD